MLVVGRANLLKSGSLAKMFLNPLVNQALSLLLLKLLVVGSHIRLVFVAGIVLFSYRGRIVGQISVTVVTVIARHCCRLQLNLEANRTFLFHYNTHGISNGQRATGNGKGR